jgi:hypothetical protein
MLKSAIALVDCARGLGGAQVLAAFFLSAKC